MYGKGKKMPYNYYPYQNYPQYQQNYQQNYPQSIIWVAGEQEAQNYPVAPNNAVALWDSKGSFVYLKTADASGRMSIRTYELVEKAAEGANKDFATREELNTLSKQLDALKRQIRGFSHALEGNGDADE